MSSYVCEKATVVRVVDFVFSISQSINIGSAGYGSIESPVVIPEKYASPVRLAKELNRINIESIVTQYGSKARENLEKFSIADFGAKPGIVQGIKSIQNFCYQCEEPNELIDWLESVVKVASFYACTVLGSEEYYKQYNLAVWG